MAIMGGAVVATAALLAHRTRQSHETAARTRLLVLFASALVMPVWSLVFLNHTLLHAIWMVRPFAWFIATAGILLDEASQTAADLVVVSAKRAAPTQARRSDTDQNPTHRQPLTQQ